MIPGGAKVNQFAQVCQGLAWKQILATILKHI